LDIALIDIKNESLLSDRFHQYVDLLTEKVQLRLFWKSALIICFVIVIYCEVYCASVIS